MVNAGIGRKELLEGARLQRRLFIVEAANLAVSVSTSCDIIRTKEKPVPRDSQHGLIKRGEAKCSRPNSGLAGFGGFLASAVVEDALAETQALRRDLDEFVGGNVFDRALERELRSRREAGRD